MKALLYTILLLLNGVILHASSGGNIPPFSENNVQVTGSGINFNRETTAPWEKISEAEIRGETVLRDFLSGKDNMLPVNAECSAETLEKLNAVRTGVVHIIEENNETKLSASSAHLAGEILKKLDNVSVTPLTLKERELLERAEFLSSEPGIDPLPGFAALPPALPEYSLTTAIQSFSAPHTFRLIHAPRRNIRDCHSTLVPLCSRDLFDNEFADLYRLFLYVRDNSGNRRKCIFTYGVSHHCPVFTIPASDHFPYKRKIHNRNHQPGVLS